MFKLIATNPLSGKDHTNDWTLEGFEGFQQAWPMAELLYNEGFENIRVDNMTAADLKSWWEVAALAGLTPSSTPEEIWAVRLKSRPELISLDLLEVC